VWFLSACGTGSVWCTRRSRRGRPIEVAFTLLELVLVVSIIGILAAVAIPRFSSSLARQRVQAAANRVVADLTLAQRHARLTSTQQTVTFDKPASRYQLVGLSDPDHPSAEYRVHLAREPYQVGIRSVDLGGDAQVRFDGYGMPDSGGTIVLEAAADEQVTVILDPLTGRATWVAGVQGASETP